MQEDALAPALVLWGLQEKSREEGSHLCDVPRSGGWEPWRIEDLTHLNTWFRDSNRQVRTDMSISWGWADMGGGKRDSLRLRRPKGNLRA